METLDKFKKRMKDIRHSFLLGTLRKDLPISKLAGNRYLSEDLIKLIEKPYYNEFYKKHINKKEVSYTIWPRPPRPPSCYFDDIKEPDMTPNIDFPLPKDININMMPVILGGSIFNCLPDNYKHYAPFIWNYCRTKSWIRDEHGNYKQRIGYLTIQEGWIPIGETQRRTGLHIERPGAIKSGGKWHEVNSKEYGNIAWGYGCWNENGLPEDGIFMASTVNHSCAIYDCLIDNPEDVTDKHGGLEHMRHLLGEPRKLRANEMCWFTDRTPHESLPIEAPKDNPNATHVYRQFFRLVVGPISVWYSKHSTPNPKGVLPDAPISDDDKFE